MISPSFLVKFTAGVPAAWQEAVQRVHDDCWVIWNPILQRHAIVREGMADQVLDLFTGESYPGWVYLMTLELDDGSPQPLNDVMLAELRRGGEAALRNPSRAARQRKIREQSKRAVQFRAERRAKAAREAWQEAREEVFEPAEKNPEKWDRINRRDEERELVAAMEKAEKRGPVRPYGSW